jgi:hypothetical protein
MILPDVFFGSGRLFEILANSDLVPMAGIIFG